MIYKLLIALLLGIIIGIFFWEKWGVGDQYKAYISKLKQKGKGNTQDVVFKPVLGTLDKSDTKPRLSRKERKEARKVKHDDRKQARVIRLNEKKAEKAVDRLEY